MQFVKLGGIFRSYFTTANPLTRASQAADSLPTALAIRNTTTDGTWTLSVTTPATGNYVVSGTVPATYNVDDIIGIAITATVAGVTGKQIVDELKIIAATPYNALILGTSYLDVNVYKYGGTTVTVVPVTETTLQTNLTNLATTIYGQFQQALVYAGPKAGYFILRCTELGTGTSLPFNFTAAQLAAAIQNITNIAVFATPNDTVWPRHGAEYIATSVDYGNFELTFYFEDYTSGGSVTVITATRSAGGEGFPTTWTMHIELATTGYGTLCINDLMALTVAQESTLDAAQVSIDAIPTAAENSAQIVADLEAIHGTGSWVSAPVDLTGIPAAVRTELETYHGTGSWDRVGGGATPEEILATLDAAHGTGSWDRVGGGATPEEMLTVFDAAHGTGSWDRVGGNSGSGAYLLTLTVTDDSTPAVALANAAVRVTMGAETYVATTNASGVASFSVDTGTWTITITNAGYLLVPQTLVVSGNTSHTYAMTALTVTPSDPGYVTGYLYCYDQDGEIEADVDIELSLYSIDGSGMAFATNTRTETSGDDGLVQFTNLLPGATYMIRRGPQKVWNPQTSQFYRLYSGIASQWRRFTIVSTATTPYQLPIVWGEQV